MNIVYLGDANPDFTSAHRANALRRLGHTVRVINPRAALPDSALIGGTSTRVGLWPFVPWINATLRRQMGDEKFDLAWIDCGAELSPGFHAWLRDRGMFIVNYNLDDPFGTRDGHKWDLYRRSVRHHDLTVVVRRENQAEARAAGARNVLFVYRSYDPLAHAPFELSPEELSAWTAEVVFIGSWMPERGPFMVRLLELGVPLTLRGNDWQKAAEWPQLKACWRGPAVTGRDYVRSIRGAKIALGLLSLGNRDQHTTRSAEVPFIRGAVFCAQRTSDHSFLFKDGEEVALWNDAEECAACCRYLLAAPERRKAMVAAAYNRVVEHRLSNDEVVDRVLAHDAIRRRQAIVEHTIV